MCGGVNWEEDGCGDVKRKEEEIFTGASRSKYSDRQLELLLGCGILMPLELKRG